MYASCDFSDPFISYFLFTSSMCLSSCISVCSFSFFLPLFDQALYPFSNAVLTTGSLSLTSTVRLLLEHLSTSTPYSQKRISVPLLISPLANNCNKNVRSVTDTKQLNKITDISSQDCRLFYRIYLKISIYSEVHAENSFCCRKCSVFIPFSEASSHGVLVWGINQKRSPWLPREPH